MRLPHLAPHHVLPARTRGARKPHDGLRVLVLVLSPRRARSTLVPALAREMGRGARVLLRPIDHHGQSPPTPRHVTLDARANARRSSRSSCRTFGTRPQWPQHRHRDRRIGLFCKEERFPCLVSLQNFKKKPSGTRGLSLLCPLIRERRPRLLALISEARRGPRGVVSTCNSTRETLGSFCEHCHSEHHHWTVVMKFQSPENTITTLGAGSRPKRREHHAKRGHRVGVSRTKRLRRRVGHTVKTLVMQLARSLVWRHCGGSAPPPV